ncbi:MAG: hypothetical protein M3Q48_07015, partial [Actinomycetota bacterium]|nr:hypothetical protein [Actinomycetota bacterium]
DASVSGERDGPTRRVAHLAYLDGVRPHIEASTAQGAVLAEVRSDAARLGREASTRQAARAARDARDVLAAVRATDAPPALSTAHAILVATVAIRERVAGAFAEGISAAFAQGPADAAVDSLARAGEELLAADRTYRVFVDAVPKPPSVSAPPLPVSAWADDERLWSRPELAAFVTSLRSSITPTPVHDVQVLVVTTDPPIVATDGSASVLPLVRTLRLEIVVANTGNAPERNVPVVATLIGPAGEVDTARDFVDLSPGQRRTITLGGLRPVPGGPSSLTVMIGPVDGEASFPDNERSLALMLRG